MEDGIWFWERLHEDLLTSFVLECCSLIAVFPAGQSVA